jgi:hydroxyacylglutathione hydrolase
VTKEKTMSVDFSIISLMGMVQCFLLKGEKTILIDAGVSGQMKRFEKGLAEADVKFEDIDLLLFTHGHFDHIGLAKEIVDRSGAQTGIHQREKDWVESGKPPFPPGATAWGKFLAASIKLLPEMSVPGTKVDFTLGDEDFSLREYGITGKVVYTPGHTLGSVSILLDDGTAIVGDLAMSAKIFRLSPGMPAFAEDVGLVKSSWQKLLDMGAKTIYPAHGKPFSAEVFRQQLG